MGIRSNLKRVDVWDKVTGRAKYTEDLIPHNTLVAKILHSTIANGVVRKIDVSEAASTKGVVGVFTCFDTPMLPYATAGHPPSIDPKHPNVSNKIMLSQRVRYYGDDIAVVVAEDEITAVRALQKIKVEYEEWKPYKDAKEAVSSEHPLHEKNGNIVSRMDFTIEHGQVDFEEASFDDGDTLQGMNGVKGQHFKTQTVQHVHIENICSYVYREGKQYVVVSPSQMPHTLRYHIAEALEMKLSQIRVIKPYIGGGFGNKQDTFYEPLLVWLCQQLDGRSISLVCTREETFVNTRVRHSMDILSIQTADEKGRLKDRGVRIHAYSGAYGSNGHSVTAYAVTNFFQLYPVDGTQVGQSLTFYSNLPSSGAMRGYGIPQITFAMESQIDDLAYENGWDPYRFRKKNAMPKDFFDPFDRFLCLSNGLEECMDLGSEKIEWSKKRQEYDQWNMTHKTWKKGVGMAIFAYKTGVYPIQLETASARMSLNEDGTVLLQIGATELGQGSDTVMTQIASEASGIKEADIHVISCQDTNVSPHDAGAYASRQTYVSGGAVKKTGILFKNRILFWAGKLLHLESDELCLKEGMIYRVGQEEALISVAQVATRMQYGNDLSRESEHITAEATYTAHANCFAFGASFVDLEVDLPIGKIKINKIVAVHDSGTILNNQTAEGQVKGGVVMGVGYAIGEQMLFDEKTLKPLNANLLDYKIPTTMDVPDIDVYFVETWEPTGPYGNKALGEPPLIPQAPAIRNAILHATGVGLYKLPMNPQNLVTAFQEAGCI